MFSNASSIMINGGTFISPTDRTSRGMELLMKWVATGAFHNSDELYDAPKCHPHTRVAVLDDIMQWVNASESAKDDFIMWLFGPAGAGKSAIAKRIAEIAAESDLLIADFFFSRISPTRNNKDRLIPTLAYQLALSIPDTRSHIEDAIERDPAIFNKNILTQIDTIFIKPFLSISPTQIIPSQKLVIIDGLDECKDSQTQVAILEAISRSFTQHNLPIKFLLVSRPEPDLVTSFNCNEPLRSVHRRLALDDTYRPDDDVRLFFSDKFEHIKRTHLLRSTIPNTWPTKELLDRLVSKSSGQFIYASTAVKFIESSCHRPTVRLNIILGISPPGRTNPFSELDALYSHLFSCVDDIQITLRVLGLYVMTPDFTSRLRLAMSPELFLSLEPGDIQLALINLSSIITYHESSGEVEILHASFVDFLSDKRRSTSFYIDKTSTCMDFIHRILQYVKGPDGIQAGNIDLFRGVIDLSRWLPSKGQLWSEILKFDLDTFMTASVRWKYYKKHPLKVLEAQPFDMWAILLFCHAGLDHRDGREALDRLDNSLESRLQIYQSDWRLQLLLALAATEDIPYYYRRHSRIFPCRLLDILLEMDDHDIHLVDQHALDLRHTHMMPRSALISYVNNDTRASAALHCMRFLSNPPGYSERNESAELGLIYGEWKATCDMTLEMLCTLLEWANTFPELVNFICDHDVHLAVQKNFPVQRLWKVDVHILAFLSRASVCSNRRIISAIQRSLSINYQQPSNYEGGKWSIVDEEGLVLQPLARHRLDPCCSIMH